MDWSLAGGPVLVDGLLDAGRGAAAAEDGQRELQGQRIRLKIRAGGQALDRVHGVATPSIKAQIVADLKEEYDAVAMVGDGINDLAALQRADVAILSRQQPGEKPATLFAEADYVVEKVADVVPILARIAGR